MTKFQKQMMTIAAAGALTAVTALPALAFENEFHGTFAVKTFVSNFDNGSSGALPTRKSTKSNNYTEQRTRLQYIAKASDDLKLVTQFELNTRWGQAATTIGTGSLDTAGGDIDTDGYAVQVKHAYLDFNLMKGLNVKAGQQAYKDTIKGLYVDADLPMALVTYKNGAYTMGLGYSRFVDGDTNLSNKRYMGAKAADLYVFDNTYAFSKDTKVGFSYYLNADNSVDNKEKKINTFGLSAETKLGGLSLSGFAAAQAGYQKNSTLTAGAATSTTYSGWAANVAAKMKVGNGTAKTGFLFTSGNNTKGNAAGNTSHNKGWQTVSATGNANTTAVQNSYVESGMMLFVRNPAAGGTSTDGYLRKPISNIALATIGYDADITDKFYVNSNVGFGFLPASDYNSGLTGQAFAAAPNGSDFLGTEINTELGYKLYKNLTLKAQAAYIILGGAYKNTAQDNNGNIGDPANPYSLRMSAHYSF